MIGSWGSIVRPWWSKYASKLPAGADAQVPLQRAKVPLSEIQLHRMTSCSANTSSSSPKRWNFWSASVPGITGWVRTT
jgi:hypothetical protein